MKSISIAQFIKRDNNNLDLIRMLCAYFVIYSHAFALSPSCRRNDILYKIISLEYGLFGSIAVKAFFLISGLLIANSLLTKGKVFSYISSRFFRIYPAFFFTVLISAFLIGPLLSNLNLFDYLSSKEVWMYVAKTLKMNIQYNLPGVFSDNNLSAVNGSLWTIPMEVKAYYFLLLIYMVSLIFGRYKKLFIGLVSIAILIEPFTPLKGYLIARSDNPDIYLLYPFFSAGCLLAILKDRITTNSLLIIVSLSLLAFLSINDDACKTAFFCMFSTMSMLYISSLKSIIKIKIKINNDISYGIYLWAFPVQQIIASMIHESPYLNMAISAILTTFIAYISFAFIESPALCLNHRILKNMDSRNKCNAASGIDFH